jgi:cytochrome c oxidase cbb3-type subunit 3
MNSIGDLIENENFSKLSEEEKAKYLEEKKFLIIRNFGTLLSKSSLLQKKKIF